MNFYKLLKHTTLLLLLTSLTLTLSQNTDDANKGAIDILDKLPRYKLTSSGLSTDLTEDKILLDKEIEDGTFSIKNYGIGVATVSGLFIVITLLGCLFQIPWCICRVGKCCGCCKISKRKKPQTFWQKWSFYFLIIINCILMVSFAGLAYDSNKKFSDAVVGDGGILDNVEGVLKELNDFINSTAIKPLNFIKGNATGSINRISAILDDTDVLTEGTQNIIDFANNLNDDFSSLNISATCNETGKSFNFECEICTNLTSSIDDTVSTLENDVNDIFEDLNETMEEIQENLFDINSTIVVSINNITDQLNDVIEKLDDVREDIKEDYRPDIEDYNDIRELAYLILFAVPLIPFIFVLLGGIIRKSFCFTISYTLMWWSYLIMFIMLSIHLPIALVIKDGCDFMDKHENNYSYIKSDKPFQVLDSCIQDTSIAAVFDISDELPFFNITFSSFDAQEITDAFDFSLFDAFISDLNSTGSETFGGATNELISQVQELINDCTVTNCNSSFIYNRNNIETTLIYSSDINAFYSDSGSVSDRINHEALKNLTNITRNIYCAELAAVGDFNDAINNLKNGTNHMKTMSNSLEIKITNFSDRITDSEKLIDPIKRKANEVIKNATCGFAGRRYFKLKTNICDDILGSLATMVLCMFLVGVWSMLSCCFAIKMVRRIKPDKEVADESFSDNDRFVYDGKIV